MTMSIDSASNPCRARTSVRTGGSGNRIRSRARLSCRTPPPVSIRIRRPPPSTTKQLNPASIRFCSSAGWYFDQSVFGTTPNIAPPSHQYDPARTSVMRKSPTAIAASALDKLSSAFEEIAGILGDLLAAFVEIPAAIQQVAPAFPHG